MDKKILELEPKNVWKYFMDICTIPRPSKKEEKIIDYLLDFGRKTKLETIKDGVGNVLIRKPATKGRENMKSVVLQSHVDMVCEKNSDLTFDFEKDPVIPYIDGGWVKAKGTTLGADDGIGIAVQLAILEASDIEHGPLECLFTIDEETGLTGAFNLNPGFLKSKILINLDSEDEGQLFIGCAGGKDTMISMKYEKEKIPAQTVAFNIKVAGLKGGHSGDDIHKGLGNAIKILNRLLWDAFYKFEMKLAEFDGGNLRNAIPREAYAIGVVPEKYKNDFIKYTEEFYKTVKNELRTTEPNLNINCNSTTLPAYIFDSDTQEKLINSLYACPHGVIAWSMDIPNLVETSTNLASVKQSENKIIITTSQRSSVESAKNDICNMVSSVFKLADAASVEHSPGYPGWKPNTNSEILNLIKSVYKNLFNVEPKVLAIHAGLECGLIGEKFPEMDMISYGPTILGVHSPDERLNIESVCRFWTLTLEVLKNIPKI